MRLVLCLFVLVILSDVYVEKVKICQPLKPTDKKHELLIRFINSTRKWVWKPMSCVYLNAKYPYNISPPSEISVPLLENLGEGMKTENLRRTFRSSAILSPLSKIQIDNESSRPLDFIVNFLNLSIENELGLATTVKPIHTVNTTVEPIPTREIQIQNKHTNKDKGFLVVIIFLIGVFLTFVVFLFSLIGGFPGFRTVE